MICFACIIIASTLASSLACACLLFLFVCFLCYACFAFAPLCFLCSYAMRLNARPVRSMQSAKTRKAGKAEENRQGERLRRACPALRACAYYQRIMFYYARACLQGGYTTARPGYFFGMDWQGERGKTVLLISVISCSRSKSIGVLNS